MITSLNFPQAISWLDRYRSPDYESSMWKGIPIAYRYHPAVLRLIRGDNERGVRLRPRYRGKSKPDIGYKRRQSYVTEEFADTFALYPVSNYRAETSLSSRKADTSGMNEPITYPVGTGNVIGSHSAQDFVWAGRAEGSQEQTSGETATSTPADTNTPYAGPITEPIGSDVHFGAESRKMSWPMTFGIVGVIVAITGVASIIFGQWIEDVPVIGAVVKAVRSSWDTKNTPQALWMLSTLALIGYLGAYTWYNQVSLRARLAV
jgi:hypothetical protein